jgi:hypothetical protein
MRLHVAITEAHIRRGARGSPLLGPVSLAVRDAVGPPASVVLGMRSGVVLARGRRWKFALPAGVRFFRMCFDAGLGGGPLEFDIDLVPVAEPAGAVGRSARSEEAF